MKKKLLILTISLFAILSLVACDDTHKEGASSQTTNSATSSTTKQDDSKTCKDKALDPSKNYVVTFSTNKGDFQVTLDPKTAPIGAAHLASLVEDKFYDGLTIHRIIKDFVIQGGDPNGDGSGGPDCSVITEKPGRAYKPGDFAWAKTSVAPSGSAGSQFFIVTGANAYQALQDLYGFAGTVTSGMDVVTEIENSPTGAQDAPVDKVVITKATLATS